jgi:hypothetical protein
MLTVAITWSPFTYTMFSFLLCNIIYMRISFQPPFVHCIYMCVHIFLVDYFLPLTGFSLFV